jgi:YegS/Rv2252/BmrU family lipid kinase
LTKKALIVLNPVAGMTDADSVRQLIEKRFSAAGVDYQIYETQDGEAIADVARRALAENVDDKEGSCVDLCVAVGGDGTISGVAGGLVSRAPRDAAPPCPLGIIPTGTGNALAQDLHISQDPEEAIDLLLGEHELFEIDAMRIGARYFFLNVGIGVSASAMEDAKREYKRSMGRLAYIWAGAKELVGIQPRHFILDIDGTRHHVRAAEIMATNSTILADKMLQWGPNVRLNDGQLYVCAIRAKSALDYLRVLWYFLWGQPEQAPRFQCFNAEEEIRIDAAKALTIQADGEVIGETPVTVHIVPRAIKIVVPVNED